MVADTDALITQPAREHPKQPYWHPTLANQAKRNPLEVLKSPRGLLSLACFLSQCAILFPSVHAAFRTHCARCVPVLRTLSQQWVTP